MRKKAEFRGWNIIERDGYVKCPEVKLSTPSQYSAFKKPGLEY
jgi:hypothetical protein